MTNKKPKKEVLSVDYLKDKVYPDLHVALIQLIDYVVKSEEVRKHQERLKKIKIFDKLEQRRSDKERLKAELGSDYESSEDSMDWEELGIDKEEVEKFMNKGKVDEEIGELPESGDQQESDEQEKPESKSSPQLRDNVVPQSSTKKGVLDTLVQIQENEENNNEDDDGKSQNELHKMKEYLKKQREESAYNPLTHLSHLLRQVQDSK